VGSTSMVVRSERNAVIGYVLWLAGWFGVCGLHRIYAGRWASGLLWLVTGGLCFVGQIVDLFFVPRMISDYNDGRDVW
jgi:TM2 domain-containing membrane protein YozV